MALTTTQREKLQRCRLTVTLHMRLANGGSSLWKQAIDENEQPLPLYLVTARDSRKEDYTRTWHVRLASGAWQEFADLEDAAALMESEGLL